MPKNIEIGERFGHWIVIDNAPSHRSPGGTVRKRYLCKCDCGTIKEISATSLRTGKTKSCGCIGSYLK